MNKRQWQILALGAAGTALVAALAVSRPRPPAAGPVVEHAPGHYSREVMDAVIPKWAVFASLGLAGLTAAAIYKSRT